MWVFEPHVAEQTFEELVAEYKIPVRRDEWLERKDGVTKAGSAAKRTGAGYSSMQLTKVTLWPEQG